MSAKRKLLILDDESDTISQAIRDDLDPSVEVSAPALFKPDGSVDISTIAAALSEQPDLILLDVIWNSRVDKRMPISVPIILESAFEEVPLLPRLKCCLVTAYHQDERGQKHLRDGYQKNLGSKLAFVGVAAKPLTEENWRDFLRNIRARIELPNFDVTFGLASMGLPGRILDKDRAVQGQNDAWAWIDGIPPASLVGDREFAVPDTSEAKNFGLYFKEYRLTEIPLKDQRTLQVAAPISSGHTSGIYQALEQTYNLLRTGGFTRMRFYQRIRVPGSDGMLLLRQEFPKPQERSTEQLQKPLDGLLLEKFLGYQLLDWPAADDLIYENVSEQAEGDFTTEPESLPSWNKLAQTDRVKNWLRLPVFCKYDDVGERRVQARGLIVLDKYGTSDTSIIDDEVIKKKVSLLAACRQLSRALQAEYDSDRQRSVDRIFRFYRKTTEDISAIDRTEDFQHEFLRFACECSGAPQARLHLATGQDSLPIEIAHFPKLESRANDGQFSQEVFPTCWQAWTTKEPVFRPKHSQADHKGLHSRVAFPLHVGSHTFGVLSLQHPAPYHFTHRRTAALRRIIDLFVFPLHLARERMSRRLWEISLAHSWKETNLFLKLNHSALEEKEEIGKLNEFKKIGAASLRMRDIATGFIEYATKDKASFDSQRVDASALLNGAIQFANDIRGEEKHFIRQEIATTAVDIEADPSHVEFVLRTVLHNAIYHGKPGTIVVRSAIEDGYWTVEVQNPAAISRSDFEIIFGPHEGTSSGRHGAGSHIGLTLARHWSRLYGASLTAKRDNQSITFILKWPVFDS